MDKELLVTWIAPVIPGLELLSWLNELSRIQRIPGVKVVTLTGDTITLDDVAKTLSEPCHLLIWSGHGEAGGLLLPGNGLVKTKWLAAQIARGSQPRVAILAACGSQLRDMKLHSLTEAICRTGINAIGFPASAGDLAAALFTVEFTRALSVDSSIGEAFDVALEAITDEPTAAGVFLTPGLSNIPFSLEVSVQKLLHDIAWVRKFLDSSYRGRAQEDDEQSEKDLPVVVQSSKGQVSSLGRGEGSHLRGLAKGTKVTT